jgi:hypothetical protein
VPRNDGSVASRLQFAFYDCGEDSSMAAAGEWEKDINVTNVAQRNIKELTERERYHDISTTTSTCTLSRAKRDALSTRLYSL